MLVRKDFFYFLSLSFCTYCVLSTSHIRVWLFWQSQQCTICSNQGNPLASSPREQCWEFPTWVLALPLFPWGSCCTHVPKWCGPHSKLPAWKPRISLALAWFHTASVAVALSSSPPGAVRNPCWRLTRHQGRVHRYHPSTCLDILPCTSEKWREHSWGRKVSVPTRTAPRMLWMPSMPYCLHSWSPDDRLYPGPAPWTRSSLLDFLWSLEFSGLDAGQGVSSRWAVDSPHKDASSRPSF